MALSARSAIPPDQTAPRLGDDRVHDPREGRVPQPRRLRQGPGRALHHQGRRGAGAAEAGRNHRRGHRRQYRDRPCARRQCARPPHRHRDARDADPRKEGHAGLCGVDLRLVPAVPYANPMHYARYSGRLAEEIAAQEANGAIWANQFGNLANRRGHYETTGPEIWRQTDGKVDGFVCSAGTGGTLSGVGIALKERNPNVKVYLADPMVAQHDRWPRRSSGRSVGSDHSSRLRQIVDQGLRGFEVACVEPLREPFVDRREKLARFLASGVGLPQPGEARGSAKFQ
jgi:Pyridoxal-phosphate dependent enzyme